jgi:hypothetical protein
MFKQSPADPVPACSAYSNINACLGVQISGSPPEWLHMTVIELTHSKSPAELKALASKAKPHAAKFTNLLSSTPLVSSDSC